MFCPGCGTQNPAQAAFCLKCGVNLPQLAAGQGYVAPPPGVPGVAAPPAPQPYRWGYIQGWGMLVVSLLFFLLFLAVLVAPESDHETRLGAVIRMGLYALGAITGFGLVRTTKMGMVMVFVWAGLHLFFVGLCLLSLAAEPKELSIPIVLMVVLAGLVFLILCSVYYYRRRHIFR